MFGINHPTSSVYYRVHHTNTQSRALYFDAEGRGAETQITGGSSSVGFVFVPWFFLWFLSSLYHDTVLYANVLARLYESSKVKCQHAISFKPWSWFLWVWSLLDRGQSRGFGQHDEGGQGDFICGMWFQNIHWSSGSCSCNLQLDAVGCNGCRCWIQRRRRIPRSSSSKRLSHWNQKCRRVGWNKGLPRCRPWRPCATWRAWSFKVSLQKMMLTSWVSASRLNDCKL